MEMDQDHPSCVKSQFVTPEFSSPSSDDNAFAESARVAGRRAALERLTEIEDFFRKMLEHSKKDCDGT